MKCIKTKEGEIKRVSNVMADEMVSKKRAVFINKTEWKNKIEK
jgi:hypothetical protein